MENTASLFTGNENASPDEIKTMVVCARCRANKYQADFFKTKYGKIHNVCRQCTGLALRAGRAKSREAAHAEMLVKKEAKRQKAKEYYAKKKARDESLLLDKLQEEAVLEEAKSIILDQPANRFEYKAPTPTGWQCPLCAGVWSPAVQKCQTCK